MVSVIGDDNPLGSARVSLSIIAKWIGNWLRYRRSARVAELADALDLGSEIQQSKNLIKTNKYRA